MFGEHRNRATFLGVKRKFGIDIMYFIMLSCIFIITQSFIYMFWITVFTLIFITIVKCIIKSIYKKLKIRNNNNNIYEVELDDINENRV